MAWPWKKKPDDDLPDTLELSADVQITATAAGKAPTIRVLAYGGGLMNVPRWGRLVINLAGLEIPGQVPLLVDHLADLRGVIGQGKADVSRGALIVEGTLSETTAAAKTVVQLSKENFPFQASVGLEPGKRRYIAPGESVKVNNRTLSADADGDGFTLIEAGTLREISIVPIGADSSTAVQIAASYRKESAMSDLTKEREEKANEIARVDGIQAAAVDQQFAGLKEVSFDDGKTTMTLIEAKQHAIAKGLSQSDFELALFRSNLRANDPPHAPMIRQPLAPIGGPAIHSHGLTTDQTVLAAAISRHYNQDVERQYGAEVAERANRIPIRHVMDGAAHAVRAAGVYGIDFGNSHSVLKAGYSSGGLPAILADVAHKSSIEAFEAVPSVIRKIARQVSAADFREHTGVKLVGRDVVYKEMGEGAEFKHMYLGEDSFTYTVTTWGKMVGISREVLINDDAGALIDLPRQLGRGAALRIEIEGAKLLLANTGPFFSVGNANLINEALSSSGLSTGRQTFREQVDPAGNPVNIAPKFLTVPAALETTALELVKSISFMVGGADASAVKLPTANTFADQFEVLCWPYIGLNPASEEISGGSNDAWYLFASPGDAPSLIIAFLDNKSEPTIEEETMFTTLGMKMRGFIDFGIAFAHHEAALKSTGSGSVGSS